MNQLDRKLPLLPTNLKKEIFEKGVLKNIPTGTEILREGQYVKSIPLVLKGLIKVCSSYEDKELLLYYIEPAESCVMSFSAGLWNAPSKVFAIAEEDSEVLLLPVELINQWVRKYPTFNELFFRQFNKRYEDLLLTIHQVLFDKMDKRLYDFLKEKTLLLGENTLDLRHHQIAREMGTAREVVSRVLKKLEKEGKIRQLQKGIEVF
jgi:CRP/FNR family transcriptional regulator